MDAFRGITIDPAGAAELDDAILVERDGAGWLVRVAVPDCRSAVQAGGSLDAAARKAGETVYAGRDARRPMLPRDVAASLSLTPGADKRVVLLTMRLGADLTPVAEPVVAAATFSSGGMLAYEEANRALRDRGHPHHAALAAAAELAEGLASRRAATGALGLRNLGNGIHTDEEGRIHVGARHAAERIVAEAMILANATLANLCAGAGERILYRNHRAKPNASRDALAEALEMAGRGLAPVETLAARLDLVVGRARLGPEVEGHWGLNLPAYAWFTSPIRRYADVVNQRVLMALVAGAAHDPGDLEELAAHLDGIRDASRDATSEYLKDRAAREARARVSGGAVRNADAAAFTGIVKATTEAGEMPGAVLDEALSRLAAGALTSKDAARLLAASPEVAARAVAVLAERPHDAVAVAYYLSQVPGGTPPSYAESSSGPSHAVAFTVSATVTVGGKAFASPAVPAATLKEGRQRAVLHALALAFGAPPPDAPAPSRKAAPAGSAAAAAYGAKNPKNRLLEACQARRWPLPRFDVEQAGPPHAPTFTATAVLDLKGGARRSSPATGSTRKEAEMAASADMLTRI